MWVGLVRSRRDMIDGSTRGAYQPTRIARWSYRGYFVNLAVWQIDDSRTTFICPLASEYSHVHVNCKESQMLHGKQQANMRSWSVRRREPGAGGSPISTYILELALRLVYRS